MRLSESKNVQVAGSWHPNGKLLVFSEQDANTGWNILTMPVDGDDKSGWKIGRPSVFLNGPSNEQEPMFSADGRWLAYTSNESGRAQVYVRPFPGPGETPANLERGWVLSGRGLGDDQNCSTGISVQCPDDGRFPTP
jgi:Tol biopolymer transport system component